MAQDRIARVEAVLEKVAKRLDKITEKLEKNARQQASAAARQESSEAALEAHREMMVSHAAAIRDIDRRLASLIGHIQEGHQSVTTAQRRSNEDVRLLVLNLNILVQAVTELTRKPRM